MKPWKARTMVRHWNANDSSPLDTMMGAPSHRPISFQALVPLLTA